MFHFENTAVFTMRDTKIGMLSLDFQDMFMRTYASSRVKKRAFIENVNSRLFLLISGGRIGVPKPFTNMASPHKALQRCAKRFGK